MAYNISGFAGAGAQFFDNNGDPLSGGLLYVYTAGTTTPVTTWTSNSGAVANTNPIVLDSAGRTPNEIWLNSGVTYKFVLKTSTGVLIGTYDNIPAIDDPTVFNNLITVTGTNALIGTSVPPYTAYTAGMTLSFVAVNTNTGAVTISVDGLGAKNIYIGSATALSGGELVAGQIIQVEYDGTRFQLINGAISSPRLANAQLTLPNAINEAAPVTLASASTVNIGAAASNNITITGTTTINSFGTATAGTKRTLTFSGSLVLTYNATSMILPAAGNVVTTAGDVAEFVSLGTSNWQCIQYLRANGSAIGGATVDIAQFDVTGTWTKPSGGQTMARVQIWGGGGGGSRSASLNSTGGGGGGGYNEATVPLALMNSQTVVVGSGGLGATIAGQGGTGGTSTVVIGGVNFNAYGGGGGGTYLAQACGGGGGTNQGAGNSSSAAGSAIYTGATSITSGNMGYGATLANPSYAGFGITQGGGGGAGGGAYSFGAGSIYGGGGGGSASITEGRSLYAGNGGANGTNGVVPSGGGGASTSANVNGGNGAAGRITITCW